MKLVSKITIFFCLLTSITIGCNTDPEIDKTEVDELQIILSSLEYNPPPINANGEVIGGESYVLCISHNHEPYNAEEGIGEGCWKLYNRNVSLDGFPPDSLVGGTGDCFSYPTATIAQLCAKNTSASYEFTTLVKSELDTSYKVEQTISKKITLPCPSE